MTTPPKLTLTSHTITEDKLRILKDNFPEVFTEGNFIDWDKLRLTLGETLENEDPKERFGLNWPGKRNCLKAIQAPTTATLLPDRNASVDFDTTENLYIEGDNLEVLKLLQKSYLGKVKMIYIDPPYNTGNDFVYPDDYTESLKTYLEYTGQVDAGGRKFSNNTETTGRFHSKWLNLMYPRLFLARNLLREDGVIFISIDDGEVAHLRKVCDEIFGEENFKSQISWQKRYTRSNNTIDFTTVIEHILVFAKSDDFVVNLLDRTEEADSRYTNPDNDNRGPWKGASFLNPATPSQRPNLCYTITNPNTGLKTDPTTNAWRRSEKEYLKLLADNKLYWGIDGKSPIPSIKMFLSEARNITPINFWDHEYAGNTDDGTKEFKDLLGEKLFENPKPTKLIRRIVEHSSSPNDIILDFFSGSATTAHAVLALNAEDGGSRKFICVQLPEPTRTKKADGTWDESEAYKAGFSTIAEIGKERIRRVIAQLKEEGGANEGKAAGKKIVKVKAFQAKQVESPSLGFESSNNQLTHNGGGYRTAA